MKITARGVAEHLGIAFIPALIQKSLAQHTKHADYDIVCVEPDRVFIIDLDLGNKSVTNDAEKVYNDLQSLWPGRRVIYRDSIGTWDEIVCTPPEAVKFIVYKEHLPPLPRLT